MDSSRAFTEAEDIPLPSSDEESNESNAIDDDDTCTSFELEKYFPQKYTIKDEAAITLKKNYVLSLAKDDSLTCLAAGLSDGSVHLFAISSERSLSYSTLECLAPPPCSSGQNDRISTCGVCFVDESPNLLLVGTTNGLVRLFDMRIQREAACFKNNPKTETEFVPKNIVCFDRNANSRVLCVGTEQHNNNVLLLFYDLRERSQMGGYCDCHQDDVTTLRFHPQNPDLLCSGSTDGMINIFDLEKVVEEDALLTTFNTASSVYRVNWHTNVYNMDLVSCITHTNDFKLYDCKESNLIAEFERSKITDTIKRKAPGNCNLINCHNTNNDEICILAGSNLNKGETMRSLLVNNKQLLPDINFQGNKQIVRDSVFDKKRNVLITGGESGIVTLWTPQAMAYTETINLKARKKKSNKTVPY